MRRAKLNVNHRQPLSSRTLTSVEKKALKGTRVAAVYDRLNRITEIALYQGGALQGTIFSPRDEGGLAVWRSGKVRRVADVGEALEYAIWS